MSEIEFTLQNVALQIFQLFFQWIVRSPRIKQGIWSKREIHRIRASLRVEKRLNFSINLRKLSVFYRSFSNRSEALHMILFIQYPPTPVVLKVKKKSQISKLYFNPVLSFVIWNKATLAPHPLMFLFHLRPHCFQIEYPVTTFPLNWLTLF